MLHLSCLCAARQLLHSNHVKKEGPASSIYAFVQNTPPPLQRQLPCHLFQLFLGALKAPNSSHGSRCLEAMGGKPSKVPGGAILSIREMNPDGLCFDVNGTMRFKDIFYKESDVMPSSLPCCLTHRLNPEMLSKPSLGVGWSHVCVCVRAWAIS